MASFAAIVVIFTLPERADACECGTPGPCQALSYADAVFTGVVTDVSAVLTPDGNSETGTVTTFVADRSFVGPTGMVVLKSRLSSCEFQFRVGERYLVYARRASDGSLTTSLCSRTNLLANADQDLAFLTSLPSAGTGGHLSGLVERVQIDLLGVRRSETLTTAASGVSVTITGPQDVRRERADINGAFTLKGLEKTAYVLEASLNGPSGMRLSATASVSSTAEEPVFLRVVLKDLATLPNRQR